MKTSFARAALLSVAVLLAMHGGIPLPFSAPWLDGGQALAADSAAAPHPHSRVDASAARAASALAIKPSVSVKPRIVDLNAPLVRNLLSEGCLPQALVRVAGSRLPESGGQPDAPIDGGLAPLLIAAPLALLGVCLWSRRMQRAMRDLARTIRESHACGGASACTGGPRRVRAAARTFAELMCRRKCALDEQAEALSAFGRHIDVRVSRLRLRALTLGKWHQRAAFIEEIEAFAAVANQFIDIAAPGAAANSALVPVDAYLRDWSLEGGALDERSLRLDLRAGPQFMLPRAALERMIGNLVGNALLHGAPPIEIGTARGPRTCTLSVRDHGSGIEERHLPALQQPSVRPEAMGSLCENWGMGLAIVSRLAESCGATLVLGNHPEGGMWARITVLG
ncbi:sensor histidine kinase [Trinickia terrae]|uniref:histidine kinase n=1 Tax=Trinickia terrae TaxID=2571161 RepID=A0A4U1HX04_9BURK|nr:ATP-binding protein [Trinickia terrae]TKC86249.1 sensor histidine kinase [Trinickia terrae]